MRLLLAALLAGCVHTHSVRPDGTTIDVQGVGRIKVSVCTKSTVFASDCDRVETPGLSANAELVLSAILTTAAAVLPLVF